ncbi:MAG: cytochrome c maturation protein CcmE [Alicyclobacillaceae bacterium]|nr:cytochrome c maturation protein CcmE [Alicyclobacillaceae bacterium]
MMSTRAKLITALVIVMGIIGVLIRTAVSHASTYYLTVGELKAKGAAAVGVDTTVSGDIVGPSVQWDPARQLLQFTIRDANGGGAHIPVVYHGDRPDDFSNDWPVIVTGRLTPGGVFEADKLLIKCPSKYQAKGSGPAGANGGGL